MINTKLKVGLICPCKIEYEQCKINLKLSQENKLAGRMVSSLIKESVEVIAIFAGPGKIQCASATQLLIDKFNLDFVIDVGASGSLFDQMKIYDIVCAIHSFEYDVASGDLRRISEDLKTSTVLVGDSKLGVVKRIIKEANGKIKLGNIACGEKNVDNKELRQKLYKELDAIAANWETSAVLKVAELNGVKSLSFRVITDNSDENMKANLYINWKRGLDILFEVLSKILFRSWLKRF